LLRSDWNVKSDQISGLAYSKVSQEGWGSSGYRTSQCKKSEKKCHGVHLGGSTETREALGSLS